MEYLKQTQQQYLNEIAEIHEQQLNEQYEQYQNTTISVALRKEMIENGLMANTDVVIIEIQQRRMIAFIWARYLKQYQKVIIEILYVSEDYRNQGIAKVLKKEVEIWAHAKGALEIESTVVNHNNAMKDLNFKLGYHISSVTMNKRLIINNEDI